VVQLVVGGDERLEPERPGRAVAVTIVTTGRISPVSTATGQTSTIGWPNMASWSASASSTASIASCWFAVGETWNRCSYFDQQSRHPASRQV